MHAHGQAAEQAHHERIPRQRRAAVHRAHAVEGSLRGAPVKGAARGDLGVGGVGGLEGWCEAGPGGKRWPGLGSSTLPAGWAPQQCPVSRRQPTNRWPRPPVAHPTCLLSSSSGSTSSCSMRPPPSTEAQSMSVSPTATLRRGGEHETGGRWPQKPAARHKELARTTVHLVPQEPQCECLRANLPIGAPAPPGTLEVLALVAVPRIEVVVEAHLRL